MTERTYRALEIRERVAPERNLLVLVCAFGCDGSFDRLQEGFHVKLHSYPDDSSNGVEEADEVRNLLLQGDDQLDALNEDGLDRSL